MTHPYSIIIFYLLAAFAIIGICNAVPRSKPEVKSKLVRVINIDPDDEYDHALLRDR